MLATKPVAIHSLELHEVLGADKEALLEELRRAVNDQKRLKLKFPGPSPVSIERADFPTLKTMPYVVCEKTDGWRALLLVGEYKTLDLCCLFDRKLTPYLVYLEHVPVALWQGSLFDGEVVWNHKAKKWTFLIFDALRVSGIPIYLRRFMERIAVARQAWEPYKESDDDSLHIRVKRFLPSEDIEALPGHMAKVQTEYKTDGVVLTPDVPNVVFGRHTSLFKLKMAGQHTVDFSVDGSGKGLCVFSPTARMHVKVGSLSPAAAPCPPGSIVECVRDAEGWRVLQIRQDKDQANDLLTYEKTCLNMKENLTLTEIISAFR